MYKHMFIYYIASVYIYLFPVFYVYKLENALCCTSCEAKDNLYHCLQTHKHISLCLKTLNLLNKMINAADKDPKDYKDLLLKFHRLALRKFWT